MKQFIKKKIGVIALGGLIILSPALYSQTAGQPDVSFNPHYDGCFKPNGVSAAVVYSLERESSGKIYIAGDFYYYNANVSKHIARVNADGSYDNSFNVGSGLDSVARTSAIQSDGKIILGGAFSSYNGNSANRLVRINTNGSIDATFNSNIGSGPNDYVRYVSVQLDGKILVGGSFTSFNGVNVSRVVRLNSDGSIDNTFNAGVSADDIVRVVIAQSDGKILIGGNFQNFGGTTASRIIRLNSDGTADASFTQTSGFDNAVTSLAVQSDGKILVGGMFTSYNGFIRNRIVRLNSNGSIDNTFNIGTGFDYNVWNIEVESNNNILICGEFSSYNGSSYYKFMRLTPTGSVDPTYDFDGSSYFGVNNSVFTFVQSNSNYVVGGIFNEYAQYPTNIPRYMVCGIKNNGLLDSSFNYHSDANEEVYSSAIQQDGRIIIAGKFSQFDGDSTKIGLARLNTDGTLDNTFNPAIGIYDYSNIYSQIAKVHVQTDGKILVTGLLAFRSNGHLTGNAFGSARLNSDGSLDASFYRDTVNIIHTSLIRPDGKIYGASNGSPGFIKLYNTDGSVDNTFNLVPSITSINSGILYLIYDLKVDMNNKLLVGAIGTMVNGTERSLFRINPDGTLDNSFNPVFSSYASVRTVELNNDGTIIIGGSFSTINSVVSSKLAKFNDDGTLDMTFNSNNPQVNEVYVSKILSDGKIVIGSYNYGTDVYKRYNADGTPDNTFVSASLENNMGASNIYTLSLQSDGNIIIGGDFAGFSMTGIPSVRKENVARIFGQTPIVTSTYSFDSDRKTISLYPNPNDGNSFSLIIKDNNDKAITLEIYDISGKLVRNEVVAVTNDLINYNIKSKLESGIYFLRILSSQINETLKFVVE